MRLFEITLIVIVTATAALQVLRLAGRLPAVLTLIGIFVAALHMIFEGTHWQMFPVLVALCLLIFLQFSFFQSNKHSFRGTLTSASALTLAAMSFVFLLLFPMFTLPKPTGPFQVGTRIVYMKDTSRIEDQGSQPGLPRELIVQIWYPADPSNNRRAAYQRASETTPASSYRSVLWTNSRIDAPISSSGGALHVLLFNHGWGERRTENTFLTEDLASHGYVVVAIDHPYNTGRVALPDGRVIKNAFGYDPINPEERTAAQIVEIWNKEQNKWVADNIFVLNTLQQENTNAKSIWYGRLNTEQVGAFGHSFGGGVSIQLCGADPRIRSGLNMDGWNFGDILHRTSNQPTMFMFGLGVTPKQQTINPANQADRTESELDTSDMKQVDASLERYGGYKVYVKNTTHMDFTDHSMVSPWRNWTQRGHISPAQIQTIVRSYVLAFFDATLKDENPPLLRDGAESPFRETRVEHVFPHPESALATKP